MSYFTLSDAVRASQNSPVFSSRLMHRQTMDFLPQLFQWIFRMTSPQLPQIIIFEKLCALLKVWAFHSQGVDDTATDKVQPSRLSSEHGVQICFFPVC